MKLDSLIMPAKLWVQNQGGRVEAAAFHKVYGKQLAERMVAGGDIVERKVLRQDIRGKMKPYEVTYLQLKNYRPQTPGNA